MECVKGKYLLVNSAEVSGSVPDTHMVNTVDIKQMSLAYFFAGLPGACKRLVNIFQFMVRGGIIV